MEIIIPFLYCAAMYRPRLVVVGLLLHAVAIAQSAVEYGRIPLVGLHDTLGFLTFALAAVYAVFAWRRRRDLFTYISVPLILALLVFSAYAPQMQAPLPPVLKTLWFELHVVLTFVAYALFGIAAVWGLLHLCGNEQNSERNQYRLILVGYVIFSVGMIFGGIWAHLAWGTYWLWTPKELWTTIVWLWYSLYLHARLIKGWSGRPVSWMGIAGFVIVMFLYAGVGLLMKSSHEFYP